MFNEKVGFVQNFKSFMSSFFSVQDIDDHYVIRIFGIKFCKKHPVDFMFREVIESGINPNKRTPRESVPG